MKQFIFLSVFAFAVFEGRSQAIRITVNEKTKDGVKPLADTKFEITFNDTIKTELTSGSDGMLGKLPIEPGTYRMMLNNPAFITTETKNIVVTEKKLTQIAVTCTPVSATKEEKKKPGNK